jgi:hypothetical protein
MLKYSIRLQSETSLQLWEIEDNGDISGAWDDTSEIDRTSAQESLVYCESKHRKLWFDEECSKLVDRRRQAKLQWMQAPSKVN